MRFICTHADYDKVDAEIV
ncbi:hypothetical protein QT971_29010 [Microcoleus sp. herbarium19]